MQISDAKLNEFIDIYQKEFGMLLDRESAYKQGSKLLQMMRLIYKPITKSNDEKHSEKI